MRLDEGKFSDYCLPLLHMFPLASALLIATLLYFVKLGLKFHEEQGFCQIVYRQQSHPKHTKIGKFRLYQISLPTRIKHLYIYQLNCTLRLQ